MSRLTGQTISGDWHLLLAISIVVMTLDLPVLAPSALASQRQSLTGRGDRYPQALVLRRWIAAGPTGLRCWTEAGKSMMSRRERKRKREEQFHDKRNVGNGMRRPITGESSIRRSSSTPIGCKLSSAPRLIIIPFHAFFSPHSLRNCRFQLVRHLSFYPVYRCLFF